MIRTFIFRCGLMLATLVAAALSVAQPSDQDRLDRKQLWLEPLHSKNGHWASEVPKALFESIRSLQPNTAKPKGGYAFAACSGQIWNTFMYVPILESDTAFQKSQYAPGDWFVQYIPQDRVLLLRNEKKLSSWMRGLLVLSEGSRAYCCNVENGDLETDQDIAKLNAFVTEQCFGLLCASGGDRYLVFLTKLRKEYDPKKLVLKASLTQAQDVELNTIFMKPASTEERVLRSKLVRIQAYYWALQSAYGHDKALDMVTPLYPVLSVVKR